MTKKNRIEYLICTLCIFVTGFFLYGSLGIIQPMFKENQLHSFLLFGCLGGFGFSMMVSTIILSVRYFKKRGLKFKIVAAILWPITFAVCLYAGTLSYIPYQIYNVVKLVTMIKEEKKLDKIDFGKFSLNTRNRCYTYFKIVGNFNPDEVTELLKLTPEKTWKIGDLRRNGTVYDFALWEIGRCTKYDVEVENQMRKTLSSLWDKIHVLNKIREENEVHLVLEVVPTFYVGDKNPCLAPPLDVIDFCHATRTEIDIDMYVYGSEDE